MDNRSEFFEDFKKNVTTLVDQEGQKLNRLIDSEVIRLMMKMAENNTTTHLSFGGYDYMVSVKRTPTKN